MLALGVPSSAPSAPDAGLSPLQSPVMVAGYDLSPLPATPTYFPPSLFPTLVPEPTPTLAPPVASQTIAAAAYTAGVEQWRSLVASIFPADTVDAVLSVMRCESGGNPNAVSPTNDHGLMQINATNFARFAGRSPYDPVANLEVAYAMSGGGHSWWAWSCKP